MFEEYPILNKYNKKPRPFEIPGISSVFEKTNYILSEYSNAVAFNQANLDECNENWKLYSGFDEGQYPTEVKTQMKKEGRNPFQGNIIRSKVDGLAGSIIKNFFDIGFEPINGENSNLTEYMKELMLLDKELLDWNASYRDLVVDGLIHLGIEELYIDTRYNPLGNIGFRRILPGHLLLDPHWLSNNAWDLRRAWKTAFLTPKEIKETYKTKSEEVDIFIRMKEGIPSKFDNGDQTQGFPHKDLNTNYTDKYRVIEYHHLEKEKKKVEIDIGSGLIVPDGPDEYKKEWAILNGVDFTDGVLTHEEDMDVYYVTTICPTISPSLVLEDKKSPIQIGRLPFFPWSSARINGRNSGIPALLKSIQQTYNFRESMLDHMIKSSASGGMLIDPSIVDNDTEKMRVLAENWGKPNLRQYTSPGALASGRQFIQELPKSTIDYGIVNELTRMIEMFDLVSKQSSTMDGKSSGSEDSGVFFARRTMQSEIAQTLLNKSLEQLWNEKGEAYVLVAKQLYSGVYREFVAFGTGKKFELNKPFVTPEGEVIENDISQLSRLKIIVSQSPEGVTAKEMKRSINMDILRVLPQENMLSRTIASTNVLDSLTHSKVEKEKYKEAGDLELAVAKERLMTEMMQLKTTQMQMQMQLQQAAQPQIPMMDQVQQQEQPSGNPMASMQGNNVAAQQLPTQQ